MSDVILLTTDVLVKAINDEYSQILASERNNLQKALAIGEKLVALRPRIAPKHGKWQAKLKEHCPDISYETATLYIRLFESQVEWRAAAAAKSVGPTDLTIEAARQLLANPRSTTNASTTTTADTDTNSDSDESDTDEESEDEEGGSDETEEEVVGKKWLETLAADDLVFWVKEVHGVEYLKELAAALAKELPPTLPPKPALQGKADPGDIPQLPVRTPTTPPVSASLSVGAGIRRPL
jgi:hypothetical protein